MAATLTKTETAEGDIHMVGPNGVAVVIPDYMVDALDVNALADGLSRVYGIARSDALADEPPQPVEVFRGRDGAGKATWVVRKGDAELGAPFESRRDMLGRSPGDLVVSLSELAAQAQEAAHADVRIERVANLAAEGRQPSWSGSHFRASETGEGYALASVDGDPVADLPRAAAYAAGGIRSLVDGLSAIGAQAALDAADGTMTDIVVKARLSAAGRAPIWAVERKGEGQSYFLSVPRAVGSVLPNREANAVFDLAQAAYEAARTRAAPQAPALA